MNVPELKARAAAADEEPKSETTAGAQSRFRAAAASDPSETLGFGLIGVGAVALLVAAVRERAASGGLAAAAIFTVLVGLCLCHPTLLQDGSSNAEGKPNYSSMRVVMLFVVTAFVMLTVKAGWGTTSLSALKVDESWAWILAAVLGGKVTQSIAEAKGAGK